MVKLDNKIIIATVAIVLAIASVFLIFGKVNSFQKKVDYLSDEYLIYEYEWKEYMPFIQSFMMREEGYYVEFETLQARSWVSFKSSLRESIGDGSFSGSLGYDSKARIIWFAQLTEVLGSRCWYTIHTFK